MGMPQLKWNTKVYRYPSCGNRVELCRQAERKGQSDGQTDRQTDRQTDMTKLVVAFRNFLNALTNDMKAEYLFGVPMFYFSFRYFHLQFSVIFVFSTCFFVKFFVLILLFLSYPTSSFYLTSPPPNISFLQISLYSHFSFHFSWK